MVCMYCNIGYLSISLFSTRDIETSLFLSLIILSLTNWIILELWLFSYLISNWKGKKTTIYVFILWQIFWSILLEHSTKNKPLICEKYLHCFFTKSISKQKKYCSSKNILKCHLPRFVFFRHKLRWRCLVLFHLSEIIHSHQICKTWLCCSLNQN